jgi:hypothetical protein
VGREQERAALARFLENARLLTLTGPGGVGKTRLALHVATSVADHYEHGVRCVSLAPLTDPALVIPTVAQELGVREAAGTPVLESLTTLLRDKHLLLVLDNFEGVLEAGPEWPLSYRSVPASACLPPAANRSTSPANTSSSYHLCSFLILRGCRDWRR